MPTRNYLNLLFLPAGLAFLCMPQRYPELRNQLGINNGFFGTCVSMMLIGSVIGLISSSFIIHKIGISKSMVIGILGQFSFLATFPHLHQPLYYIATNICFGMCATLLHISINTQGIHMQKSSSKLLLPTLHGFWGIGAISVSLISALTSRYLSLCWYADLVAILGATIAFIGYFLLKPELVDAKKEYDEVPTVNLKTVVASFKMFPALSISQILIVQSEFSAGDWSSIFAHNSIGVSIAKSSICFMVFMSVMTTMRLNATRINHYFSEKVLIKWLTRIGAVGFGLFLVLASLVAKSHLNLAYLLTLVAYIFLGLGNSFMIPFLFSIASRQSAVMPGMIVASLGLVVSSLSFFIRIIISWVAQFTNLTIALMIPTLMLFVGSRLHKFAKDEKVARS